MKSSILLFVTLTVCFRLVFSLDCTNAPGISFIPCKNPSASSTGGSGGSGGSGGTGAASSQANAIVVEPCTDIQYNGGAPQKYTVTNQAVPQEFELLFESLNIPDEEKLLIKTFKCDPNNDCKIAVIDSTAATPLSVNINKYSFSLASRSSSVSATFKLNYNCSSSSTSSSDCDDFTQEGNKLLKQQPTSMTFQECFDACETAASRMLKVTSRAESNALPPGYSGSWLGVKQTGPNNYKWNDNTTFTVTLANGNIPEYSTHPWYTYFGSNYPTAWDKSAYDSNNCVIVYSAGWFDSNCNNQRSCVCECTLTTQVDGGWSDYGPWSSCNTDCEQERTRACDNPPPSNGGQDCIGDGVQIQSCTGGLCAPAAADCSDFTQAGNKLLKKQPTSLNFQGCFDACETAFSRMLKITSRAESNALPPDYRSSWLGVKQTGPNTYKWNDDTTFTVTLANGNIPEYSTTPWYTYSTVYFYTSGWDATFYDSKNCLMMYPAGWIDNDCSLTRACVCECTLP